jgi:PAS domain S-box-containing protein
MNVMAQFPGARDYDREPRLQAMFEGSAIGIGICQLDGQILEANPALARMLGYSQQELTDAHAGALYLDLRRGLYPEIGRELHHGDFSSDERWLGELMRGERSSFEIEKRYRRNDGSELCGHLTVSLGRDARMQPAFLIAMLADATERKRVEEHLREAEKMEVIGRLAGGIAHDFNNLLTGILLYCDLLSAGLQNGGPKNALLANGELESAGSEGGGAESSELCQHVEEVRMAGEQGAALTHQLLAIARKQAAEPRPVRINEIVASMENLLRRLIGEPIELVILLDPVLNSDAGLVLADPAQLRQILMNLALNARDAMPQGGAIRLSTRAAEIPGNFPSEISSNLQAASARRAVALAVKDNGCGMTPETRSRLFEPFFTTKNPGEGTGLGLATVQRIVSEAGGIIEVESEPGRGTCIEVFFPAVEVSRQRSSIAEFPTQASEPVAPPAKVVLETGRKTILLVDDHPAARKSMHRVLLDAGHLILAASSGKEALNLFAEHSGAVDLLIADCTMPGMNGQELAETLVRQKPGLKVVLISGYQDVPVESAVGTVELIRKPFSRRALIERVVEVLRSP